MSPVEPHKLYGELATWWPLLSPPSHYVEEAADLLPRLLGACAGKPRTLLELGAGGGSLAFHLKAHFELTLTDRSEAMSAVSRAVNPECEHRSGDMRSLRLDREFDLVLIHDAIMYLTDPDSVRAALATAALHCRIGGGLALLPDCVRESFTPKTSTGGEDGPDGRALRYLEWRFDRDPRDQVFEVAFAFLLREGDAIRVERDHHTFGLFSREEWFGWIREAGFAPESRIDPWRREVFIGRRR